MYFDGMTLAPNVVADLNTLPQLIVISRFTRDHLIRLGVRTRMHILPLGVDAPDAISLRPVMEYVRILCAGYLAPRKGVDVLKKAFSPFEGDDRIRLTIMNGGGLGRAEWFEYLGTFDYFVYTSRMESFGLIGLEAAAMGTAPIYPIASAVTEYATGIPYGFSVVGGQWGQDGWEIDIDELSGVFRYIIETGAQRYNRDAVTIAARIHSWDRTAEKLEEISHAVRDR